MEIGSHCSLESCKMLDFLPFVCQQCQLIFCQEHHLPEDHSCSSPSQLNVPYSTVNEAESDLICSVHDCGPIRTVHVVCDKCSGAYCLKHRDPFSHQCHRSDIQPQEPIKVCQPSKVRTVDVKVSKKVYSSARESTLAAKVALMKLKQRAKGKESIPQSERVYYEIILPQEYGSTSQYTFVCKLWAIGKVVDVLASQYKLQNKNDQLHSKKLQLLSGDGETLLVMSDTVENILDSYPSGSILKLVYS